MLTLKLLQARGDAEVSTPHFEQNHHNDTKYCSATTQIICHINVSTCTDRHKVVHRRDSSLNSPAMIPPGRDKESIEDVHCTRIVNLEPLGPI